jgi:hypothetical protein
LAEAAAAPDETRLAVPSFSTHGPITALLMKQQPAPSHAQQQLGALQAQRSVLTDQLESQTIRRDYLNQQLSRADGQAAAGLRAQLDAVDASVKATTDALARVDEAVNRTITNGLPAAYTSQTSAIDARIHELERVAVKVGTVGLVGIAAIAVLLIQSFRRRRPKVSFEDSSRLEQLQRAVDTIAIEVERISEAQRFMARSVGEDKKIPR